MLALDCRVEFDPGRAEEVLETLPPRPAVVLVEPRAELAGARPLLLRTADLRRRLQLLLRPSDPASKRISLRDYAAAICFRLTGSAFEQAIAHWQQARTLWPRSYRQRLRLRPPPLVRLNLANPYPRVYVTRRISAGGVYFGPFATRRSAEAFLDPFLDLFRIRRCQIKIRRDPHFPGCIYSEMKMCLAPCFAGCTEAEYAAEVQRVVEFLASRGDSLSNQLVRERDEASAQTDFERAAATHRRLEKVDAVLRLMPGLVRCLNELDAVVLQRAAEPRSIAVFAVHGGRIADPFLLRFAELASQPRSVEQILRHLLEPPSSASDRAGVESGPGIEATERKRSNHSAAAELEDQLTVLGQWFYGRPRQGEIVISESKSANWPYRRILRACSRLLTSQDPQIES